MGWFATDGTEHRRRETARRRCAPGTMPILRSERKPTPERPAKPRGNPPKARRGGVRVELRPIPKARQTTRGKKSTRVRRNAWHRPTERKRRARKS